MGNIENHANVANQTIINIQSMSGNIGSPYFVMPSQASIKGGVVATSFTLNTNYYNLFVIGDESFSDGHFIVPKDRALTESITPENKEQFSALSDEAISLIKTFPSLFASENHHCGKTDDDHNAILGLVSEVRIQDNGIKIHFQPLWPIPQQRINEIASQLAIQGASSFNELNRTHWAIKRLNLIEELKAAGISVLAPT
ncbi:hypothetical protein [Cloacibacillus sp.]